ELIRGNFPYQPLGRAVSGTKPPYKTSISLLHLIPFNKLSKFFKFVIAAVKEKDHELDLVVIIIVLSNKLLFSRHQNS
ncbi:hypothetical protein L9F63_012526, partial [Diploptera punctata]